MFGDGPAGALAGLRVDGVERRRVGVPQSRRVAVPELPPLKPFGAQCDFHAAGYAAFLSLPRTGISLRTGVGQAVDVSEQEAVAAMLEMNFMH